MLLVVVAAKGTGRRARRLDVRELTPHSTAVVTDLQSSRECPMSRLAFEEGLRRGARGAVRTEIVSEMALQKAPKPEWAGEGGGPPLARSIAVCRTRCAPAVGGALRPRVT
ncbi:unnamed protein product, partial [Iphiclides podalirius]